MIGEPPMSRSNTTATAALITAVLAVVLAVGVLAFAVLSPPARPRTQAPARFQLCVDGDAYAVFVSELGGVDAEPVPGETCYWGTWGGPW